ncbi:serine esterase, putative [Plasmodium gallinaceum]|uniref:Serine esterase, putative n=1 Tax=Plasmodium gallinaceum TaxID=5849 RepID=A0A1J1GUJ3_PLAGA|nr:serine esterase, putative [Plasmodium gallinaceum]CRG96209.1 serine esterase, putative [Plasmodium gallinaceum]
MREKNLNYRSESIFSTNRNLFEMLETIDDEKEAKRSAHFFNNNKNILLSLFKNTNYNNNVNNILLEKKKKNHVINSKDNENKNKEMEIENYKNELPLKNNTNYEKKKWMKNFCWFCSLHLLDEILEKEIYKEKIHEDVYELIYDEDTYFDTSSMMSIPYEFARFMLSQMDDNVFHKIKINNLIKEEKNLIKKICKNCTYNKKYNKMSDVSSSNHSCSSISVKSDNSLNINKKKERFNNLDNFKYLNIHEKLNDINGMYSNDNKNNTNKEKKFYDSNNIGNNSSSDLFYNKVQSNYYISNSNIFFENFYLEKKKKLEYAKTNKEDVIKSEDHNNNLINNDHNNNSSNYYRSKILSEPILISHNLIRKKKENVKMKNKKKNSCYEELHRCDNIPFDEKNKKEKNFILNKSNIFEDLVHNQFLKRSNSFHISVREKNKFMNKIKDTDCYGEKIRFNKCDEKEELNDLHKLKYMPNSESCCENLNRDNMNSEIKDDLNNYNERVYNKYKNNLNYIKRFYYIDETKKKPFPLCLYNNIRCYSYVKQCVRCCCFFNSECCHCIECKKKYHMKLKNPHYFIFQHGLTASVNDFQNIVNPLLKKYPHLFIYITYSNQSHTFEGVDVGTERICTELICLFKIINDKINISMIGHSLGGILNRSVLINLYKKKVFKNKKLINFITFACPHIGVHENLAVMKILSTYLGAHTIDDLNNKTTLLLRIANVKSINVLKKFENIIFYGNTQSDWLVGIRTSLILPYTLFNEELILFIIEQAKNVPEIPINIFSVVHLYMRKKKLLFFYFYQDLKNPNYLLNKRKEQSKFLDQMLQTIISSSKLLSYSQKKKFNIFMNYYSNSEKKKVEEKKNMNGTENNGISTEKNMYSKCDNDGLSDEKNCKSIIINENENKFESDNYFKRNLLSKSEKKVLSDSASTQITPFYLKTNSRIKQVNNSLRRNSFSAFNIVSSFDKDGENEKNYKKLEVFKSHTYEEIFLKKKQEKIHSNVNETNMNKKYIDQLNKKIYFKKYLNIPENNKSSNFSNTTKNFELIKNGKVQNLHENSFMKEESIKVKNENKDYDFNNDTINYDTSNNVINDNDTINDDNINIYNNKDNNISNNNYNINNGTNKSANINNSNYNNKNNNINNDHVNNNSNNNHSSDNGMKKKFGDYKYFEKLFFECLKTKIINEIKTLDNNLKKKKKKKIENNKLFSLQNTIKIIKNYSFLYPSKNNLKNTKDFNDKKYEEESKFLDDKLTFNDSNKKEKRMDKYSNEQDESEHDLIHLCDDNNDEYNYINEFFYSSDEMYENELKNSSNKNILVNKMKNSIENIKCVECKKDMTINTITKKKLKRSNLLKGITKSDKKKYKQILFHIYTISNDQLIEKFFKNPEFLYYEVLFNCLNQLPIQRYSISIPIYSNAHVQIIAHPRICSEEAAIVKHFIEHLIL